MPSAYLCASVSSLIRGKEGLTPRTPQSMSSPSTQWSASRLGQCPVKTAVIRQDAATSPALPLHWTTVALTERTKRMISLALYPPHGIKPQTSVPGARLAKSCMALCVELEASQLGTVFLCSVTHPLTLTHTQREKHGLSASPPRLFPAKAICQGF
jgi:hypothetical protein